MNDYEKTHASTIAVMLVPHEEVSSYGVIAPQGEGKDVTLYSVETFKLKSQHLKTHQVISHYCYLLTPEIFGILESQKPGGK